MRKIIILLLLLASYVFMEAQVTRSTTYWISNSKKRYGIYMYAGSIVTDSTTQEVWLLTSSVGPDRSLATTNDKIQINKTDSSEDGGGGQTWTQNTVPITEFNPNFTCTEDATLALRLALASNNDVIFFPSGCYLIDGDIEIPPGKVLLFEKGAIINVTGSITGNDTEISASFHQIFTVTSNVRGTWIADFFPAEWFGAIADGKTDSRESIQATLNAFQKVDLRGYSYYVAGTINIRSYNHIKILPDTRIIVSASANKNLFHVIGQPFWLEGGVIMPQDNYTEWIIKVNIPRSDANDRQGQFKSMIRDMRMISFKWIGYKDYSGKAFKGLKIESFSRNPQLEQTYHVSVNDLQIYRSDTAVFLTGKGVVNAWQFSNLNINWSMRPLILGVAANGCVFSNLMIQNNTLYNGNIIKVFGSLNTIQGFIWDLDFKNDSVVVIEETALNNFINMGNVRIYRQHTTDKRDNKSDNYFQTTNPFEPGGEPGSSSISHYYSMDRILIGTNYDHRKTPPRLLVASDDYPVGSFVRRVDQRGGGLETIRGVGGALSITAKTSTDMVDGFGPGLYFIIKDNETDSTRFQDNIIGRIFARRDGSDESGAMQFFTNGSNSESPTMTLNSLGNVGIGTTSPENRLHVLGTTTIDDVLHLKPRNTEPSPPAEGMIYYNARARHVYMYINGSWVRLD